MTDQGCLCHKCGNRYRVDLNIPNHLWNDTIMLREADNVPADPVHTMLCGMCIMQYLERVANQRNGFGYLTALTGSIR